MFEYRNRWEVGGGNGGDTKVLGYDCQTIFFGYISEIHKKFAELFTGLELKDEGAASSTGRASRSPAASWACPRGLTLSRARWRASRP